MSQHLSLFTANIWKLYCRRLKLKWWMLTKLTTVIISHTHIYIYIYTHTSSHYTVHLKVIQCYVNYISVKLKKKRERAVLKKFKCIIPHWQCSGSKDSSSPTMVTTDCRTRIEMYVTVSLLLRGKAWGGTTMSVFKEVSIILGTLKRKKEKWFVLLTLLWKGLQDKYVS